MKRSIRKQDEKGFKAKEAAFKEVEDLENSVKGKRDKK